MIISLDVHNTNSIYGYRHNPRANFFVASKDFELVLHIY